MTSIQRECRFDDANINISAINRSIEKHDAPGLRNDRCQFWGKLCPGNYLHSNHMPLSQTCSRSLSGIIVTTQRAAVADDQSS